MEQIKCICCEKDVHTFKYAGDQLFYLEGMVTTVHAGYGSTLDGDSYHIAICDTCIENKRERGIIEFKGNIYVPFIRNFIVWRTIFFTHDKCFL